MQTVTFIYTFNRFSLWRRTHFHTIRALLSENTATPAGYQAWEEPGILATLCRMGRFGRSGIRGLDPGKDPGPRLRERKISVCGGGGIEAR